MFPRGGIHRSIIGFGRVLVAVGLLLGILARPGSAAAEPAGASGDRGTVYDSRVFEWRYYTDPLVNPDLQAHGVVSEAQARQHWATHGIREGRRGGPAFYTVDYLARYPDLRAAFGPANFARALTHYLTFGQREHRTAQSSCPKSYLLSDGVCFSATLNARVDSTQQTFAKYLFRFPIPARGMNVAGMRGTVSIDTATAADNPSEALFSVGVGSGTCPANGTAYHQYPLPIQSTSKILGSFIVKRQGAGRSATTTAIDFPAVKAAGSMWLILDGGPSLGPGRPIGTLSMRASVTLKLAGRAATPGPYRMNGPDEYCFLRVPNCSDSPSTGRNATIARVVRVSGSGGRLVRLAGNVSAGSLTRPTGAWSIRNDWYLDAGCTRFPMAGKAVGTFTGAGPIPVPAGVPSFGFTLAGTGDTLQRPVNQAVDVPVRSGADCMVHLVHAVVNSEIDAESQVAYVIQP